MKQKKPKKVVAWAIIEEDGNILSMWRTRASARYVCVDTVGTKIIKLEGVIK